MKTQKLTKKEWAKPVVQTLKIKKDTFGGSGHAEESSQGTSKKPNVSGTRRN